MLDLNEEAGVPYITMEYVKGENLKRLIRKVGHLSPTQALPYACQICDGLADDDDASATGQTTWHPDSDGDTYGSSSSSLSRCDAPPAHVSDGTDCDDSRAHINPGETEACDPNDYDEDCDGLADDAWASWCPPCLKETPLLIELQNKYGEQGLQIIGLAVDDEQSVRDFVDTEGIPYPVVAGELAAMELARRYGNRVDALPFTAFVDRNGDIVQIKAGEIEKAEVEKIIQSLL